MIRNNLATSKFFKSVSSANCFKYFHVSQPQEGCTGVLGKGLVQQNRIVYQWLGFRFTSLGPMFLRKYQTVDSFRCFLKVQTRA